MTMFIFNTYKDLVAATPSAGDTAVLLGYTFKGDGGGGELYWNSASTETPHGSTIIQRAAGGTGRWFRIFESPDGPINVKWFGAVGDGTTPDQAAIDAAIAYCVARNLTLGFPDGTYMHSGTINWAFNNFHVMALGDNVVFVHTGTGIAHNFSGMANYPGTQGCVGGVFGGPGRFMLKGNPAGGTTRGVNIDNWHFGYMKVAIHDAATCLYGNDTGVVGASCVETTFDVRVSNNTDGAFAVQPGRGVELTSAVTSVFEKLVVEGCGAGGVAAIRLNGCIGNQFNAGTCESNAAGGIFIDSASHRNTFFNFHAEVNGASYDWDIAGDHNSLGNCAGGGTASGQRITGTGNLFKCGDYTNLANNGDRNVFLNVEFQGSYSGTDLNATIVNPGGTAPVVAVENAPSILGNKTINTQNAITLKINGNTVNAVTGTGSTVPLSVSPRLTGQVEIGANVAADSTLTVNNNTGTAVTPALPRELHLIGADAAFSGVLADTYGAEGLYLARVADGTQASKSALGANTSYFAVGGQTWDGSAYNSNLAIEFMTVNAQTASDHSSRMRIKTVAKGSTTIQEVASFGSGVSVGTATDYGLKNSAGGGFGRDRASGHAHRHVGIGGRVRQFHHRQRIRPVHADAAGGGELFRPMAEPEIDRRPNRQQRVLERGAACGRRGRYGAARGNRRKMGQPAIGRQQLDRHVGELAKHRRSR